jgi:dihydrofolate reductase
MIAAFIMTSVDGFFEGDHPWDIDWHTVDEEFNDFAAGQLDEFDTLVFGRSTYVGMAAWSNTTLVKDARDLRSDKKLLVLGSAVLTTSLLEEGLLDELRIMVAPVLIGSGRSLASTATRPIPLALSSRREFGNGNVLLVYCPA